MTETVRSALLGWLERHGAELDWTARDTAEGSVERWRLPNGRTFFVSHSINGGWEIWTPLDTNRVQPTFEDAEQRLGLTRRGLL